jgi:hypothetical protein
MNGAILQQKIYGGYARAAQCIGAPCTVYRPGSALNPIVPGNVVATLAASFNAEDMAYQKPQTYGKAIWYCLADGAQVRVGDYLASAGNTFFIAATQMNLPILAVKCNRSVRIGRMPVENGPGYAGYSGVVQSEETDVLGTSGPQGSFASGWPASILLGGKADADNDLPSSVKEGGVVILLPASVPVAIVESDILQDDLGRDYAIAATELSDMGWRILATEEHS